jgi:hypothetical protein
MRMVSDENLTFSPASRRHVATASGKRQGVSWHRLVMRMISALRPLSAASAVHQIDLGREDALRACKEKVERAGQDPIRCWLPNGAINFPSPRCASDALSTSKE